MKNKSLKKRNRRLWIIASVIFCIVMVSCLTLPPSFGKTKPFLDDSGNVLSGSISEKIFIDINGDPLGMFIMAKDENKPVILFLSGGPGIPGFFLEQKYPTGLANEFVVCFLEYRGTSISYNSNTSADTMCRLARKIGAKRDFFLHIPPAGSLVCKR